MKSKLVVITSFVFPFVALPAVTAQQGDGTPVAATDAWDDWSNEWYLPTEFRSVKLYVREVGHGDPVIVLHGGWGAEHSYLLDLARPHTDEYRFVFYDQRGSLRSPAKPEQVSYEIHIADLDRLRKSMGLDRLKILGHSMGAHLAMAYLNAHPDRVSGLVLLGAAPAQLEPPLREDGTPVKSSLGDIMRDWAERPAFWDQLRAEGLMAEKQPTSPSARPRLRDDLTDKEQTHQWRISFAAVNLYDVTRWRRVQGGHVFYNDVIGRATIKSVPGDYNYLPSIAKSGVPVSIIIGDHDYVDFGPVYWPWAAERTPNVKVTIVKQAGHNSWIDQPTTVAGSLGEALKR